jgi:DNA modification methylase
MEGEVRFASTNESGKMLPSKLNEPHKVKGNYHPTVKPVALMKYLITLITPKGGKVLDPFNGSGSTGMACVELGYEYTGCELDPDYIEISKARIEAWYAENKPEEVNEYFDKI